MIRKLAHMVIHQISKVRSFLYRNNFLKSFSLPGPVISIGNISMGGTGKSPIAISVCEQLIKSGHRPAILTRGYRSGLKANQSLVFIGDQTIQLRGKRISIPIQADEAKMQAMKLNNVPIIVGANRLKGAQEYLKINPAPTCWILDDGFQHQKIKRDINILLMDAEDPLRERQPFPESILREPLEAIQRADLVLFTRSKHIKRHSKVQKQLEKWCIPNWDIPFINLPPSSPSGRTWKPSSKIGLVTAIAQPLKIKEDRKFNLARTIIKPDHRPFSEEEIIELSRSVDVIVTTEKDYWRDPTIFQNCPKDFFLLPIKPDLPKDFYDQLDKRLSHNSNQDV